jgi:UTP-glucose-1-phosphate uridylyltransferase
LTDALAAMAAEEGLAGWLFEGERYDAGDVAGYLLANLNWARKVPRLWKAVVSYVQQHGGSL